MDKDDGNQRSKKLGTEPIVNLLMKHSIPAIVGMLVNALYNIVDRVFIGRGVGGVAIGGVFLGMPLMLIIMAFAMLVGIGGNTLVSIRLGQKKKDEADHIASNSLMLLIIIGIVFSILGLIFLQPLLKLFGASASNIGYATDYLRIILLGVTFNTVGFGMNNFIRGEGNPNIAMLTMLIGAFLNIALDYIFIMILKMGVQGAALATITSQFISAIWVLYYFYSKKSDLKIQKKYLKIKMLYQMV
ncbi:MAG: MATE family efflux transporter [Tissierella sp.]|uniref:MATE family efflux transporter n=1 Tax=Tissierella sp. TaxID=41274 RepID=UPI003F96914B